MPIRCQFGIARRLGDILEELVLAKEKLKERHTCHWYGQSSSHSGDRKLAHKQGR